MSTSVQHGPSVKFGPELNRPKSTSKSNLDKNCQNKIVNFIQEIQELSKDYTSNEKILAALREMMHDPNWTCFVEVLVGKKSCKFIRNNSVAESGKIKDDCLGQTLEEIRKIENIRIRKFMDIDVQGKFREAVELLKKEAEKQKKRRDSMRELQRQASKVVRKVSKTMRNMSTGSKKGLRNSPPFWSARFEPIFRP